MRSTSFKLQLDVLTHASNALIKCSQSMLYSMEISALKKEKDLPKEDLPADVVTHYTR